MNTSNQQLQLGGVRIRQDVQGRHCLNDLHKAAVAQGANKRSTESGKFFRSPRTKQLLKLLEQESATPIWGSTFAPVNAVESGPYEDRGTYVCIELVIAYGQFVSAAFDLKVIRTFLGVINQTHSMPHIQNTKFWDRLRPHWAAIALLALAGHKNKQIAPQVSRSAGSVGRCLLRMYEVGYLNPVEVFKARLSDETAKRWAVEKPIAATWGKPANSAQLSLFSETIGAQA